LISFPDHRKGDRLGTDSLANGLRIERLELKSQYLLIDFEKPYCHRGEKLGVDSNRHGDLQRFDRAGFRLTTLRDGDEALRDKKEFMPEGSKNQPTALGFDEWVASNGFRKPRQGAAE
jgi:hypothetical protein